MKKLVLAPLALAAMFALSSSMRTPPVAAAATAPEFGACRWYCGSKSFQTQSACQAACTTDFCEKIC